MMKIGEFTTRNFDLRNFTAPNAFFYSHNDPHTDDEDMAILQRNMAYNPDTYFEDFPDKNHIDFIWSTSAQYDVYERIVQLDNRYPL